MNFFLIGFPTDSSILTNLYLKLHVTPLIYSMVVVLIETTVINSMYPSKIIITKLLNLHVAYNGS